MGCYGEDKGYRFMVLERLDIDLLNLAETSILPVSVVADLGIIILSMPSAITNITIITINIIILSSSFEITFVRFIQPRITND